MTRFNDNRRLHLFVVDVASGRVEQLTDGEFYEHSVEWSPNGQELAFLTNRDTDHDDREQRIPSPLVARRKNAGVSGDEARAHRS